ncbi:ParA family protein [Cutibacterium acnes]|uniref:ParA family protein n=1 Tax=Actinomycetes TaxID=1760 RepID=UPI000E239D71|nr:MULTISPECIES: ParA family protein [Actinomycetes]TGY27443.1 ParA family protein [Propionibacterium sp. NM47_B9-13]MBU5410662.1 ParA family protein [Cutibacterium acnes]MCT7925262.1 ParA family protein [Cutibacterium acnes]REB72012.1 cobalamin biosynthesis protein CobQ [Cutibacterium modestum]RKI31614.1 ParA family protein [Cutibacterium acnes]
MTAQIFALCNQKGGVGKSTTTFHLARAAVLRGQRVLVVDNDPQGNLTSVAAAEPVGEDQAGLADALSARAPETIRDVIVPGVWPGLDVVPTSGVTLGYVRDELVIAGAGREGRLREVLAAVAGDYDVILIDCAPSLDQLTINGLTAAQGVVVVTHSKLWSANGLAQLLDTIESVRAYYNPELCVAGIIVNQHEENTVSGKTWLGELAQAAESRGLSVLSPPIPKRVVIADATEAARGLDEWGSAEATALGQLYADHLTSIEGVLS